MPYCPKCGNKVDETMAFCPKCGTSLKCATPSQAAPATQTQEKQVIHENPEKGEHGFVYFLIGGLILIVVGVFAILFLTGRITTSGQDVAIMLIIIGIIIIIGAVYVNTSLGKDFQRLISHPKKQPIKSNALKALKHFIFSNTRNSFSATSIKSH